MQSVIHFLSVKVKEKKQKYLNYFHISINTTTIPFYETILHPDTVSYGTENISENTKYKYKIRNAKIRHDNNPVTRVRSQSENAEAVTGRDQIPCIKLGFIQSHQVTSNISYLGQKKLLLVFFSCDCFVTQVELPLAGPLVHWSTGWPVSLQPAAGQHLAWLLAQHSQHSVINYPAQSLPNHPSYNIQKSVKNIPNILHLGIYN